MTEQNDSPTLSHLKADHQVVKSLYDSGFITQEGKEIALEWIYPHQDWQRWSIITLRILGVTLILAGLIYFFAFNWEKMSSAYKLTVVELGLTFAVATGLLYHGLTRQLALTAASILVGVFFAVFGQIYQTGVDAYVFFLTWSVLILPWVVMAQFAALWFIWAVLVNFAVGHYMLMLDVHSATLCFALYLLNTLLIVVREYVVDRPLMWAQQSWHQFILLSAANIFLVLAAVQVNRSTSINFWFPFSYALIGIAVNTLGIVYYFKQLKQVWPIVILLLGIALSVLSIAYELKSHLGLSNVKDYMIDMAMVLVLFIGLGWLIKKIAKRFYLKKEQAYEPLQH